MSDTPITNGYRYNAFISYAWANNRPFAGSDKGWVSVFLDTLENLLDQALPRALSKGVSRRHRWLSLKRCGRSPTGRERLV